MNHDWVHGADEWWILQYVRHLHPPSPFPAIDKLRFSGFNTKEEALAHVSLVNEGHCRDGMTGHRVSITPHALFHVRPKPQAEYEWKGYVVGEADLPKIVPADAERINVTIKMPSLIHQDKRINKIGFGTRVLQERGRATRDMEAKPAVEITDLGNGEWVKGPARTKPLVPKPYPKGVK